MRHQPSCIRPLIYAVKTTIEHLNEKAQERDAEAVRERERATTILQQNESIELLQNTVNEFGGQIGQVVKIVNDLASQQNNRDDLLTKELQTKSVYSWISERRHDADNVGSTK